MLNQVEIQDLEDFFTKLSERKKQGVYFYRINGFNEQISKFLVQYYQTARNTGVVIEGRIPNPDDKQLAYYAEMMGMEFCLSEQFIETQLKKWLPRMNDFQRTNVAKSIVEVFSELKRSGKNENMIKNAYIKFMCWMYYKFERVVNQLGNDVLPKIMYEGAISNYELLLIQVLVKAGCDVVLIQYEGDQKYLQLDAKSEYSRELKIANMGSFPADFNIKFIRTELQREIENQRLYGIKPTLKNCTNAWISGKWMEDVRASLLTRGEDKNLFYNVFVKVNGVEDKVIYLNELQQLYLELVTNKRRVVIVDDVLEVPTMEEISKIKRNNYSKYEQLIMDLQSNISYSANTELQRIMVKSFVDIMLDEVKKPEMTVNKLSNKAVYLLCWLQRYQGSLFSNWKQSDVAVFIYLGGCKNENEAMFMRFLSRLPIDVVILNPNLNRQCVLTDNLLYEVKYYESLQVTKYPKDSSDVQFGTTAYHAERELDTLMYQNTGLYRNQQYSQANAVSLQTMYEEIAILWNQEMKYRPNFNVCAEHVNLPVIYTKVCGVPEGNIQKYWVTIKQLLNEDTLLIKNPPFVVSTDPNPLKNVTTEFFKNGKLQKNKIKEHAQYQYGVLREEMQDHILNKLQLLIDNKVIKGTFENGMEYTIIATVLNMKKEIVRMIQKFDFTKGNPKVVYVNTTEDNISLEDTILTAFFNLIGFDIVFFIPTGYQTIEKYYNKKMMDEHQVGEYMYDLTVPDFNQISDTSRSSWKNLFKRGT